MVVVIPSYNNSKWCIQNLDSVFSQHYSNYRVIYIDDCSDDYTFEIVQQHIIKNQQSDRVILLRNKKRVGALANHYKAVHMCQNHEIIVQLDGDDWFKHDKVLQKVNAEYQNPEVWLTYGQYEMLPPDQPGISRKVSQNVITQNGYRESKWVTSALRTFYAGLFKQIKLQDLLYKGTFFKAACDLAFMFPMLEMSAGKIKFIDEILYVYNCSTANNDFKKILLEQLHYDNVIRAQKKYSLLFTPPYEQERKKIALTDVFIFANNKSSLEKCVKSIGAHLLGIHKCFIFSACAYEIEKELKKKAKDYPEMTFVDISGEFKKNILKRLLESEGTFIVLISDTWEIKFPINISECVQCMEKTFAYSFSFSLGQNITYHALLDRDQKLPPMLEIEEGVRVWQFMNGEYDWRQMNNFNATMYRKNDLKKTLNQLSFNCPEKLLEGWRLFGTESNAISLCFEQAKAAPIQ